MIYQLKISLLDVKKPPVWRRVLIDADITFAALHKVIQEAMGWEDCHLFAFGYRAYDPSFNIAIPNPYDWEPPTANASKTKVRKYLNSEHPRMKYVYDFGDDWLHDIVLENVFEAFEADQALPLCLAAKGACPPEDCGGPWGYEDLKRVSAKTDLTDEEFERLKWFGIEEYFDPKKVDLEEINQQLKSLAPKHAMKRKTDPTKQRERVALLQRLLLDFLRRVPDSEYLLHHAFEIISLLEAHNINLTSGKPEIWAAAIVIFAQEDMLISQVTKNEIYDHFGVKASGVEHRINNIYDTYNADAMKNGWADE